MSVYVASWRPHDQAGYDDLMKGKCDQLLREIVEDPDRRRAILASPSSLHHELFESLVPPGFEEYAGTCRGTPGTSLVDRTSTAQSVLNRESVYSFCGPNEVPRRLGLLLGAIESIVDDAKNDVSNHEKLLGLAFVFCWFGKIHPFLDGNGHVQRAIFAAMATEMGYPLSSRFVIHPRPYDCLLALALEAFTRAAPGTEDREILFTSEYLGYLLDGPFTVPRANLPQGSLYA